MPNHDHEPKMNQHAEFHRRAGAAASTRDAAKKRAAMERQNSGDMPEAFGVFNETCRAAEVEYRRAFDAIHSEAKAAGVWL